MGSSRRAESAGAGECSYYKGAEVRASSEHESLRALLVSHSLTGEAQEPSAGQERSEAINAFDRASCSRVPCVAHVWEAATLS